MANPVLVVEDDPSVRELVGAALAQAGYVVESVATGEAALQAVARSRPSAVVLDVGLPGIDGWQVCERIRAWTDVPILFLTARADDESMVHGLRLGGDDYVAKPFTPAVLAARVEALLRRAQPAAPPPTVVEVGGLRVDLARAEVEHDRVPARLTAAEFRILATLAQRAGEVVSPRELMRSAQGYDVSAADAYPIVKVHVHRIRQKIEPDPDRPTLLRSVRGVGYVLSPHPQEAEE